MGASAQVPALPVGGAASTTGPGSCRGEEEAEPFIARHATPRAQHGFVTILFQTIAARDGARRRLSGDGSSARSPGEVELRIRGCRPVSPHGSRRARRASHGPTPRSAGPFSRPEPGGEVLGPGVAGTGGHLYPQQGQLEAHPRQPPLAQVRTGDVDRPADLVGAGEGTPYAESAAEVLLDPCAGRCWRRTSARGRRRTWGDHER